MNRFTLMTTVAALIAAPSFALAQSGSPEASTDTGSAVSSVELNEYDSESPEVTDGSAESDPVKLTTESEFFQNLVAAKGDDLSTMDGDVIGRIDNVEVNAQGNTELVIDLVEGTDIAAEMLVMEILPDNVMMKDGKTVLDTSLVELEKMAKYNSGRDSDQRVTVTLF